MRYELYYWTGIQGRGEFIRLALEEADADYDDVAREQGDEAITQFLAGSQDGALPFAPPFLKAGKNVIAQVANILQYLGPPLGLVPESESRRLYAHQLELTISDLVAEVHDSHHPIAGSLYYKDQRKEARRRSADLRDTRLPKYLGYFEQVLQRSGGRYALRQFSYVDLSLFQLMEGLEYAFPRAMQRLERNFPLLHALKPRIAARPNIAGYLDSSRRLPFNEDGIFRHYGELDDTD
ncbi:MAG: glutathione S-transferase [Rhodanobacter sp.]